MTTKKPNKLRAIALLSAVTGATLIGSSAAQSAPPRWPCEDITPNQSFYGGLRCSYEKFPFSTPSPNINAPRPNPGPPYAS